MGQQAIEGGGQRLLGHGLGEKQVEARAGAVVAIGVGGVGGEGDQGDGKAARAEGLGGGDAVEHGHVAIEQDEIERSLIEAFKGELAVCRQFDEAAEGQEQFANDLAVHRIVHGDEDARADDAVRRASVRGGQASGGVGRGFGEGAGKMRAVEPIEVSGTMRGFEFELEQLNEFTVGGPRVYDAGEQGLGLGQASVFEQFDGEKTTKGKAEELLGLGAEVASGRVIQRDHEAVALW